MVGRGQGRVGDERGGEEMRVEGCEGSGGQGMQGDDRGARVCS